jgi:hypothetical protein
LKRPVVHVISIGSATNIIFQKEIYTEEGCARVTHNCLLKSKKDNNAKDDTEEIKQPIFVMPKSHGGCEINQTFNTLA